MENNSPITIHQKVEYITHNHVDTNEILFRLKRIERRVERDTAAEEALSAQNEELRKQLEELLSGDVLPPAAKEKVGAIVEQLNVLNQRLTKGVADHTPTDTSAT